MDTIDTTNDQKLTSDTLQIFNQISNCDHNYDSVSMATDYSSTIFESEYMAQKIREKQLEILNSAGDAANNNKINLQVDLQILSENVSTLTSTLRNVVDVASAAKGIEGNTSKTKKDKFQFTKRNIWIVILVIIAVILIGAGVGIYFMVQGQNKLNPPSENDDTACDLSDNSTEVTPKGSSVSRDRWPWLVALLDVDLNFFCSGTLISKRHILTGAHCMQRKGVDCKQQKERNDSLVQSDFVAYLGRHDVSKEVERGSQIAYPLNVTFHPDWDDRKSKIDADIAIITLTADVAFTSSFFPICMWDTRKNLISSEGIVAGWDQPALDPNFCERQSIITQEMKIEIVSNSECTFENYKLTESEKEKTFCGKYAEGSEKNLGDSGSGVFMKSGKNWFLRGIVTTTLNSNVSQPAVYTNILKFTGWILEKTGISLGPEIKIVTRSQWGAEPPGPAILYLKPPSKRVMISHTVTPECTSQADCSRSMHDMQVYHQSEPLTFNDIYCNFFIGGDGMILEGRGWLVRGEHTVYKGQSHNDALCVAFIGNFSKKPPKQSNFDAFFKLLDYGVSIGMLDPDYVINAQRDFNGSVSPGDALYNIIKTWPRYRKYL